MIALLDSVFFFPLFWQKITLGRKQPIKSIGLSLFPICALCIYFGSLYVCGGTCYGRFCWMFFICLLYEKCCSYCSGCHHWNRSKSEAVHDRHDILLWSSVMSYHEKSWSGWGTESYFTLVPTMNLKIIAEKWFVEIQVGVVGLSYELSSQFGKMGKKYGWSFFHRNWWNTKVKCAFAGAFKCSLCIDMNLHLTIHISSAWHR